MTAIAALSGTSAAFLRGVMAHKKQKVRKRRKLKVRTAGSFIIKLRRRQCGAAYYLNNLWGSSQALPLAA